MCAFPHLHHSLTHNPSALSGTESHFFLSLFYFYVLCEERVNTVIAFTLLARIISTKRYKHMFTPHKRRLRERERVRVGYTGNTHRKIPHRYSHRQTYWLRHTQRIHTAFIFPFYFLSFVSFFLSFYPLMLLFGTFGNSFLSQYAGTRKRWWKICKPRSI